MKGDKLDGHDGYEMFLDVAVTMTRWAAELGVAK
jgi:hypothetical protein